MIGEEEYEKLLDKLGLNEERAKELMDKILEIASEIWRAKKGSLITDRVADLLLLAKNKEEAYFVGVMATTINYDMIIAQNPILATAPYTIKILERISIDRLWKELIQLYGKDNIS